MDKFMFYLLWCTQLIAHTIILLLGISYFVMAATGKVGVETSFIGFIFIGIFVYEQKKNRGLQKLWMDRKNFINEQNYWKYYGYAEINKRYSISRKKEIKEKTIRKTKGGRYTGEAEIEPFHPDEDVMFRPLDRHDHS